MALTDAVVRQAKITTKDYTLSDTGGLLLFVSRKGAKKWHFRFSWLGKQQRIALGRYPELSLKQAREQRDDLRAQISVHLPSIYKNISDIRRVGMSQCRLARSRRKNDDKKIWI